MKLGRIAVALSGPDLVALAHDVWERQFWGRASLPWKVTTDGDRVPPSEDWIDQHSHRFRTVAAFFNDSRKYYLIIHADTVVQAAFDFDGTPDDLVHLLSELPFSVASFETRYPEWRKGEPRYRAPGFSRNHFPHGWACAFRGSGHESLVSRRWLDTGPWKLIHGPNDTTLAQFHDLDVAAAEALAQAKPAHQRMGISEEGGFLQTPYVYGDEMPGLYDERSRLLKIVVLGRTVSAQEMLDACATRRDNVFGPERPVDNVAFIFLDPAQARAHLPRLWPYGLECWTIIDEVETRLDTDEPPPGVGEST